MLPSLWWRRKRNLSEVSLTRQWGGGASDFLLVFPPWKEQQGEMQSYFPWWKHEKCLPAWLDGGKLLHFLSFPRIGWSPTLRSSNCSQGIRSPCDSVADGHAHGFPPICIGESSAHQSINHCDIFTWLNDTTLDTACPKVKQSSSPKHISLSIMQVRAPGICLQSFPVPWSSSIFTIWLSTCYVPDMYQAHIKHTIVILWYNCWSGRYRMIGTDISRNRSSADKFRRS